MSRRFVIRSLPRLVPRKRKESGDIHPATTGSGKAEALVALALPGPSEIWRGEWGQVAKSVKDREEIQYANGTSLGRQRFVTSILLHQSYSEYYCKILSNSPGIYVICLEPAYYQLSRHFMHGRRSVVPSFHRGYFLSTTL